MPTKIKQISQTELSVDWNDGHKGRHALQLLRRYCPCASCKVEAEEREATEMFPILTPGKNQLKSLETIGNYALRLQWGDGHNTGIYTYDYLRQICECSICQKITAE